MSDPMVLAENGVPVERVRAGSCDHAEVGTTRMEKFFNESTIGSASLWVYCHPDDKKFIPEALPEPNPVTIRTSGGPDEFSGEPAFGKRDAEADSENPTE
jgi:hypothetical protein